MILMKCDIKLAVIGGDARQVFCAKSLSALGFETALYGFDEYNGDVGGSTRCTDLSDALYKAKAIILPLPATTDGITLNNSLSSETITLPFLFSLIEPSQLVLYGKSNCRISEIAEQHKIQAVDYYDREEFKVANAVPTAESAVAIAVNETPSTLCGSVCLVMGYGRIGKMLCRLLRSFGAKVYVSARKCEDFVWIESEGCNAIHTDNIRTILPECEIIFNTIPKTVLKDELLSLVKKNSLIIDLASKPGGVDFEPAKKAGLDVIWALSLPGKTAPISAGEILSDTIVNILTEKGVCAE